MTPAPPDATPAARAVPDLPAAVGPAPAARPVAVCPASSAASVRGQSLHCDTHAPAAARPALGAGSTSGREHRRADSCSSWPVRPAAPASLYAPSVTGCEGPPPRTVSPFYCPTPVGVARITLPTVTNGYFPACCVVSGDWRPGVSRPVRNNTSVLIVWLIELTSRSVTSVRSSSQSAHSVHSPP